MTLTRFDGHGEYPVLVSKSLPHNHRYSSLAHSDRLYYIRETADHLAGYSSLAHSDRLY